MKKYIITILVVVALLGLYPVDHSTPQNDSDLPFNARCPAFLSILPSSFYAWFLEQYYFTGYVKTEWLACSMKIFIDRSTSEEKTTLPPKTILDIRVLPEDLISPRLLADILAETNAIHIILPHSERPDLAAYFLQKAAENHSKKAAKKLAVLYYEGRGVPQDKDKSAQLFRSIETHILPFSQDDECASYIKKREIDSNHLFHNEQIRWFQSLCYKSTEELYGIAEWHMDKNNPYQHPNIALPIFYYLYYGRGHDAAQKYADQAWYVWWPEDK